MIKENSPKGNKKRIAGGLIIVSIASIGLSSTPSIAAPNNYSDTSTNEYAGPTSTSQYGAESLPSVLPEGSSVAHNNNTNISSTGWVKPSDASVSSGYGPRSLGDVHKGIDFSAPEGAPVYAASDGVVSFVGKDIYGGNIILISHPQNNKDTLYAHMQEGSNLVAVGDKVKSGQRIASVGNTGKSYGSHLHFEVRSTSTGSWFDFSNDIDPAGFLTKNGVDLGAVSQAYGGVEDSSGNVNGNFSNVDGSGYLATQSGGSKFVMYSDVDSQDENFDAIKWSKQNSISLGWSDGTFRPDETVSKKDTAVFLYRLAGSPDIHDYAVGKNEEGFLVPQVPEDVQKDTELADATRWVLSEGLMEVDDKGRFNPKEGIDKEDIKDILWSAADPEDTDSYVQAWYSPYGGIDWKTPDYKEIAWTGENGFLDVLSDDYGNYDENVEISRGEMMNILQTIDENENNQFDNFNQLQEMDQTPLDSTY